jgi:hypothetical protein
MSSNQYDAQASTNYKEAFSLFDKRGNGRVTLDNLGDLLRACGQNPTMTEIKDLEKTVGGDCESGTPPQPPLFTCAVSCAAPACGLARPTRALEQQTPRTLLEGATTSLIRV